jgi:hypothetical protein
MQASGPLNQIDSAVLEPSVLAEGAQVSVTLSEKCVIPPCRRHT